MLDEFEQSLKSNDEIPDSIWKKYYESEGEVAKYMTGNEPEFPYYDAAWNTFSFTREGFGGSKRDTQWLTEFKNKYLPSSIGSANPKPIVENIPQVWKHGTASQADIRLVDPIEGASASELGLGVYLTTDSNVAKAASLKGDLPNVPFHRFSGSNHNNPKVYEFDSSGLRNVLDGNKPMGGKIRTSWKDSVAEALSKNNEALVKLELPQGTKIGDMFNKFKTAYFNTTGHKPSETLVRDFQQSLTEKLMDDGVEGIYLSRNGVETLAVYTPHNLRTTNTFPVSRLNTLDEMYEGRRFLSTKLHQQMGDEVSKAEMLYDQKRFADYQLEKLAEQRLIKESKMSQLVDELTDYEGDLTIKQSQIQRESMEHAATRQPEVIKQKYTESLEDIRSNPC